MDVHSLFNFPIANSTTASKSAAGEPQQAGGTPAITTTTVTASAFINPQSLAAFPLASGLVAAFWKGAQLLGDWGKPPLICFAIAMIVALVNYAVSVTDPKLNATRRDIVIGLLFALINGVYLFVTAVGIEVAITR
ncbi:MAG: hypothetical protein WBX38_13680 [Candidatus Sulfotelmatobacter sp.]